MSEVGAANIATPLNKDASALPKFSVVSANLNALVDSTIYDANTEGVWLGASTMGAVNVTVSKAADVWHDIVDISGAGFLTHILSPRLLAAGDVDFRITIDGAEITISDIYASAAARAGIGCLLSSDPALASSYFEGLVPAYLTRFNSGDLGRQFYATANGTIEPFLPHPNNAIANMQAIRFDESLKVEYRSTAASNATSPSANAAALYQLTS